MTKHVIQENLGDDFFVVADIDCSLDLIKTNYGRAVFLNAAVPVYYQVMSQDNITVLDRVGAYKSVAACHDHGGEEDLAKNCLREASALGDQESQRDLAERLLGNGDLVEAAHWNLELAISGDNNARQHLSDIFHAIGQRIDQFIELPESCRHDRVLIAGENENAYRSAHNDIVGFLNHGIVPN